LDAKPLIGFVTFLAGDSRVKSLIIETELARKSVETREQTLTLDQVTQPER
jgi:hypothetical protein